VLVVREPAGAVPAATGYDTQDMELDILVSFDGSWELKDAEALEQRVRESLRSCFGIGSRMPV
jgi:hypothetical protein